MEKIDILSLTKDELAAEIEKMGEKSYRAKQIYDWLHVKKATDFSQMSNLSAQFRDKLSEKFCVKSLKIKKRLAITREIGYNNNRIRNLERVGTNPTLKCVLRE